MPKWLKIYPIAVKEWKRESKELDEMGIMTTADLGILALRCYLASEIQLLAIDIEKEGRTVISIIGVNKEGKIIYGDQKTNPKVTQRDKLIPEYRHYGNLLGLDPSCRAKLKSDKPKQQSRVELFRSKRSVAQN